VNSLLRLLRKERTVVRSLTSLGLTTRQTFELLTHPQIGSSASATEVLGAMFDASDRLEGGQAIVWFNDFESDSRYVILTSWALRRCMTPFAGQVRALVE
jgi:UDP-glucose:glycoprotein glucosyltransferase